MTNSDFSPFATKTTKNELASAARAALETPTDPGEVEVFNFSRKIDLCQ
jgi:hypothetical protein